MTKQDSKDPLYVGDGIYRENILDHYKNPRNKGTLERPDIKHTENNPLCGDEITVTLKLDGKGNVDGVKFLARGCAISIASMSILSENIKGKSIKEISSMDKGYILEKLNIPIGPVRLKCALLGLTVLKNGIQKYQAVKETR